MVGRWWAAVYYQANRMATPKIPEFPGSRHDPELFIGEPERVTEELERILGSRHFRSCKQGKRFLQYIVEQTLQGNTGLLKERLLGAALFDRAPDYATGEDSVVRVQANDVRRRLKAYYAESTDVLPVVIELPVGSYVPVLRIAHEREGKSAEPAPPRILSASSFTVVASNPLPVADPEPLEPEMQAPHEAAPHTRRWALAVVTAFILICCVAVALAYRWRKTDAAPGVPEKLSEAFWEPLVASPSPAVIFLGQTAVYRPTEELFRQYTKSHPGEFVTDNEKLTLALPLDPNDSLRWKDLDLVGNYGFTIGSVRSAIDVAGYLARHSKAYGVRLGTESSFADLRNFPAVLVGAFNNRWTLELTSGLHFSFTEEGGQMRIREEGPANRTWSCLVSPSGSVLRDYGVITRQTVWKTGQSVISVAGIGDGGTEAATEMATKPDELAEVLSLLPAGWEKKNLQVLVSTDITDGEAGRPRVIAYYVW